MPQAKQGPVRVAIIGAGQVSDFHHVPGLKLDPRAELAAICDPNAELLAQRAAQWGIAKTTTDYKTIVEDPNIDAVVIATPNFSHQEISNAAARAGKHVMCEKPLALNAGEVRDMYETARAADVVHMTAFTYRFAPSMRYMRHLVKSGALGTPRHFRSQRFLDLPETSWGWRQYKDKAGAGDLFDMTIHRIDFAMDLLGPIKSISGALATFAERTSTPDGGTCPPSNIDDWSALIGQFESGCTGVWEGTVLAKGHYKDGTHHEWAEVNGSEGSAVYRMHDPNHILLGSHKHDLQPVSVPAEFMKPAGSPRDIHAGLPSTVFRYDLVFEFVSAIVEGRQAIPSYLEGWRAQMVADATIQSFDQRRWVDLAIAD